MHMIPAPEVAAFEGFVQNSSDRLLRTAYLLCGDRGHAEDLVQTTLLRTARRWSQARDRPQAYARAVLVNLVKDRWRDRARRPAEAHQYVDPPHPDDPFERSALLALTRQLSAGQRAVLVLRFFEDLSVEDTAAVLGCSTGTVKSQTHRALGKLRLALTDDPTRLTSEETPC